MTHALLPLLTPLDRSGELCARSVERLSVMTRDELERFLDATARASATAFFARAPRTKPQKAPRTPRWRR